MLLVTELWHCAVSCVYEWWCIPYTFVILQMVATINGGICSLYTSWFVVYNLH
jgi:hypothetical protein